MNTNQSRYTKSKAKLWAGLYILVVLFSSAYFNYTVPYSPGPDTTVGLRTLALWLLLYIPLLITPLILKTNITELGFAVTPSGLIVMAFSLALCAPMAQHREISWGSAAIEAFGRTGEEIFFRGFLIAFLAQQFGSRRWAWWWAAFIASALFALVHTQIFQPTVLEGYRSAQMPNWYKIIERLFNILCVGLGLSIARVLAQSVLPSAIIHGLLNSGPLTLPFALLIYALVVVVAFLRGEKVVSGFAINKEPKTATRT